MFTGPAHAQQSDDSTVNLPLDLVREYHHGTYRRRYLYGRVEPTPLANGPERGSVPPSEYVEITVAQSTDDEYVGLLDPAD